MYYGITGLDKGVINNYPKMSEASGKGVKIHNAMNTYTGRLNSVISNGFYSEDTSTAHGVISALNSQMAVAISLLDNIDVIFDEAIQTISEDILDKEDKLAASITEG